MLNPELHPQSVNDHWLHERHRYQVLSHVYRRVNADCTKPFACAALPDELGFTREEVFRIIHDLEYRGYLAYIGSGPRVRLTPLAVGYLLIDSGRRRSIRGSDALD